MNNYTKGTLPGKQKEPETHWAWGLVGAVTACVLLYWISDWLISGVAK